MNELWPNQRIGMNFPELTCLQLPDFPDVGTLFFLRFTQQHGEAVTCPVRPPGEENTAFHVRSFDLTNYETREISPRTIYQALILPARRTYCARSERMRENKVLGEEACNNQGIASYH
jgi:hypothetical protein